MIDAGASIVCRHLCPLKFATDSTKEMAQLFAHAAADATQGARRCAAKRYGQYRARLEGLFGESFIDIFFGDAYEDPIGTFPH